MEADVLPVATCLVTAPKAGIALCACPAVERDDEGTSIVTILGHDGSHVGHTVEAERIAGSYPSHVGLEYTYTGVAHLAYDVALQQRLDTLYGVQVRLCPQTYLHATLAGILAKLTQVLHVAFERTGLSVAGTVTVVGEHPSERHVVSGIAVYHGAGRELVVVLLTIERLLDAAIVLLALLVALAILEEHAVAVGALGPVVAVVGIEVTLVETELGQQHGITGELVEVVEQGYGTLIDHHEEVHVVAVVRHGHQAVALRVEVILTGLEGIPHHAVATGRPVVGSGRSHTAVDPVV